MKKRLLALLVTVAMVIAMVPAQVVAATVSGIAGTSVYSIGGLEGTDLANTYIKYTLDTKTGGFSIDTLEGHPQKDFDNNIPLLYQDVQAKDGVTTSFTTVRIDGKDYIFGRDYSFLDLRGKLSTPIVGDGGRSLSVTWTLGDYQVTQLAAVSTDSAETQTGTVALSYSVKYNGTGTPKPVSIRVMLDTALGNSVDAPYLNPMSMGDGAMTTGSTILTETVYTGTEIPDQIRGVDSLTNPEKMSYLVLDGDATLGAGLEPDKVILGHWANLANTRYDYIPDAYTDFSNYSNQYATPDAAVALYWENVATNGTYVAEVLYGVGNFDNGMEGTNLGLSVTVDNVELDGKGGYQTVNMTATLDNSVSTAKELVDVKIAVVTDSGVNVANGEADYTELHVGEVKDNSFALTIAPQANITGKAVTVGVTATEIDGDTRRSVTYSAGCTLLVPGLSEGSKLTISAVAPGTVYTSGTKNITLTGKLEELTALDGSDDWKLQLVHQSGQKVDIAKGTIAFLDDKCTAMTFSTEKELIVGEYEVVFTFQEPALQNTFGQEIRASQKLTVSNDPKYKLRTYGIMALVASDGTRYHFAPFDSEEDYQKYAQQPDRGTQTEVLLVIRGAIRENLKEDGTLDYYSASHGDGDITINNILTYVGESPLTMTTTGDTCKVSGDGLIQVINSIDVWSSKWSFNVQNGVETSLAGDGGDGKPLTLQMDGVGYMLQAVAGFLIEMKYGEMTVEDTANGPAYGISFGGSISLPIIGPKTKPTAQDDPDNPTPSATQEADDGFRTIDDGSLSADQPEVGDALNTLFDTTDDNDNDNNNPTTTGPTDYENNNDNTETNSNDNASGDSTSEGSAPGNVANNENQETGGTRTMGALSAEIQDIIYGQDPDNLKDIGFVGIDTSLTIGLPKDMMGAMISNAPGVSGTVTINTLNHYYALEASVELKVISCEGKLAFKQTEVGGSDVIVPEAIAFYIRDGLQIPLAPPAPIFLTGMGGGIDNLADTIGGEFESLPPTTIAVGLNLEIVEVLKGQLDGTFGLEGLEIVGTFALDLGKSPGTSSNQPSTPPSTPGPSDGGSGMSQEAPAVADPTTSNGNGVDLEATLSARWIDPVQFGISGTVSVAQGLLSGGISITIGEDTFCGYAFVKLCIPENIPVLGGKEIAGVEAAVTESYIGANVAIIGITAGVIYYWNGDFAAGRGIKMSADNESTIFAGAHPMKDSTGETFYGVYGTNFYPMAANTEENVLFLAGEGASITTTVAGNPSAILVDIPFDDNLVAEISDFAVSINGAAYPLTEDNALVQHLSDGGHLYVSVQNPTNGAKTIGVTNETVTFGKLVVNGVTNIIHQDGTPSASISGSHVTVDWATKGASPVDGDTMTVYLTQDKNILTNLQKETKMTGTLGTAIGTYDLTRENTVQTIPLPDGFASGTYYVVTSLHAAAGGVSNKLCQAPIVFENQNLPMHVESVSMVYAGDRAFYLDIQDPTGCDYTDYLVEICHENGDSTGVMCQYNVGDKIFLGTTVDTKGNPVTLEPGKRYIAKVKTLKDVLENNKHTYYYGDSVVSSAPVTLPALDAPKLLHVESNVASDTVTQETQLEMTYTFDRPVWMVWNANGIEKTAGALKDTWTIHHDLVDGKYVIDFTARGLSKDSITAAQADAPIGFTVDTQAPVLTLMQGTQQDALVYETTGTAKEDITLQSNIVRTDKDGNYTIGGISEPDVALDVDGTAIAPNPDGTFAYDGTLGSQATAMRTLTAVDKAGNLSQMVVYLLNEAVTAVTEITLCTKSGENYIPIKDHALTMEQGEKIQLYAVSDGTVLDTIYWDLFLEKNKIAFDGNGQVTALTAGESALKAFVPGGLLTNQTGQVTMAMVEDYVILTILEKTTEEVVTPSGGGTNTHQIKVENTENGTVTLSHNKVLHGTSLTVTATPDRGYQVKGVYISDRFYSIEEVFTIPEVTGNLSIRVEFGPKWENPFVDVSEAHWFYDAVRHAYENDIMHGTGATTFDPNGTTTRGMMVTILGRLAKADTSGYSHSFTDVASTAYYDGYVAWGYENGIVKGISETEFAPDRFITRQEMAAMVYHYLQTLGDGYAPGTVYHLDYLDAKSISSWAMESVSYLTEIGLLQGNNNQFYPQGDATRAEMATVMLRLRGYLEQLT